MDAARVEANSVEVVVAAAVEETPALLLTAALVVEADADTLEVEAAAKVEA